MAKVVGIGILLVGMILIATLIGTVFLYMGWNWGLVPALEGSALHLREIGFATAFWLSMCLSTIGGFFKTSVTTRES
jgi:hypothetical protein